MRHALLCLTLSALTAAPLANAQSKQGLVDCKKDYKDPKCQRPSSSMAGTIGSGPKVAGTSGFPSIHSGFLDGTRILAAVEMGAQSDANGIILSVDVNTGERKVVSGKYEDPAQGPVSVGSGPDLGNVSAVSGNKGAVVALVSKGTTSPVSLIKIDVKTGNRALDWSSDKQACKGLKEKFTVDPASLAVGPDGTAYLSVWNYPPKGTGLGIVGVKAGACQLVSMSGAENNLDAKGTGPTIGGLSPFKNLTWGQDGKIWALHPMTNSLVTFDPATGNRARVSSGKQAFQVGQGPEMGYAAAAFDKGKFYTVGNWTSGGSSFRFTEVAANGERKSGAAVAGPLNRTMENPTAVYAHPTKPLLILSVENAFLTLDPSTGESNVLSI